MPHEIKPKLLKTINGGIVNAKDGLVDAPGVDQNLGYTIKPACAEMEANIRTLFMMLNLDKCGKKGKEMLEDGGVKGQARMVIQAQKGEEKELFDVEVNNLIERTRLAFFTDKWKKQENREALQQGMIAKLDGVKPGESLDQEKVNDKRKQSKNLVFSNKLRMPGLTSNKWVVEYNDGSREIRYSHPALLKGAQPFAAIFNLVFGKGMESGQEANIQAAKNIYLDMLNDRFDELKKNVEAEKNEFKQYDKAKILNSFAYFTEYNEAKARYEGAVELLKQGPRIYATDLTGLSVGDGEGTAAAESRIGAKLAQEEFNKNNKMENAKVIVQNTSVYGYSKESPDRLFYDAFGNSNPINDEIYKEVKEVNEKKALKGKQLYYNLSKLSKQGTFKLEGNNHHFLILAAQTIVANDLGYELLSSCKSGKDRQGLLSTMTVAMRQCISTDSSFVLYDKDGSENKGNFDKLADAYYEAFTQTAKDGKYVAESIAGKLSPGADGAMSQLELMPAPLKASLLEKHPEMEIILTASHFKGKFNKKKNFKKAEKYIDKLKKIQKKISESLPEDQRSIINTNIEGESIEDKKQRIQDLKEQLKNKGLKSGQKEDLKKAIKLQQVEISLQDLENSIETAGKVHGSASEETQEKKKSSFAEKAFKGIVALAEKAFKGIIAVLAVAAFPIAVPLYRLINGLGIKESFLGLLSTIAVLSPLLLTAAVFTVPALSPVAMAILGAAAFVGLNVATGGLPLIAVVATAVIVVSVGVLTASVLNAAKTFKNSFSKYTERDNSTVFAILKSGRDAVTSFVVSLVSVVVAPLFLASIALNVNFKKSPLQSFVKSLFVPVVASILIAVSPVVGLLAGVGYVAQKEKLGVKDFVKSFSSLFIVSSFFSSIENEKVVVGINKGFSKVFSPLVKMINIFPKQGEKVEATDLHTNKDGIKENESFKGRITNNQREILRKAENQKVEIILSSQPGPTVAQYESMSLGLPESKVVRASSAPTNASTQMSKLVALGEKIGGENQFSSVSEFQYTLNKAQEGVAGKIKTARERCGSVKDVQCGEVKILDRSSVSSDEDPLRGPR